MAVLHTSWSNKPTTSTPVIKIEKVEKKQLPKYKVVIAKEIIEDTLPEESELNEE
jgi:hypothetical protein